MSQPTAQTGGTNNAPPAANTPPAPTEVSKFIYGASLSKKVLSLMAFFMAFVTVMMVLFIYMNNTGNFHVKIIDFIGLFYVVVFVR